MNSGKQVVLFVIPEENMRSALAEALDEYNCPYPYKIVSSVQQARIILSKEVVCAIIMTTTAALAGDNGTGGLVSAQTDLPPTMTLIQHNDDFPDYLYIPEAFNDWCTVPFSLEELFGRLTFLLERANRKSGANAAIE